MSEKVKRYDNNGMECAADYSHMRFVLASDFEALQQRCREANSLADQWAEKNEQLAQRCMRLEAQRDRAEKARAAWEENATLLDQDCDALRAEVERLKERERLCPTMEEAEARAMLRALQEIAAALLLKDPSPAQLVTEVGRMRKDAERYRCVRNMWPPQFTDLFECSVETGEPFDKLVDAAMEAPQ